MTNNNIKKPVLLCILDGFGIEDSPEKKQQKKQQKTSQTTNDSANAIALAKMPNYQRFLKTYPNSQLQTSGHFVGLPDGQIGNSEVGHMTIGAGRIIYQDLPRINNSICDQTFENNRDLVELITKFKNTKKTCHLVGLISDGGVHSHIDHIVFLADFLQKNQVKVLIHGFLDGRDVAQKSALDFLEKLKNFNIATISGRYFAMDRDQKWDRIELASQAILNAIGKKFKNAFDGVNNSYQENITDEFVKPFVIADFKGVEDEDGLIFCNFRADRARQISQKFLESKKFSLALSFTQYSPDLNKFYKVLFPKEQIKNSLGEVLEKNNLHQLRIAETEKYAHVTFFFSCGKEKEFSNETRILIPSPQVATYDLKPEMSSLEVGNNLCKSIESNNFDFILANYANPDMVGHSGIIDASIKACEAIDYQLGILEKTILACDGMMLISADHGNVECMIDENNQPHTSHTTNPVPFILVANNANDFNLVDGGLSDIAPSILQLLKIAKPIEMTGSNLIKTKNL
jgi:2,3-bisphosphoglycerate-independent phosphoglycerate mutase